MLQITGKKNSSNFSSLHGYFFTVMALTGQFSVHFKQYEQLIGLATMGCSSNHSSVP